MKKRRRVFRVVLMPCALAVVAVPLMLRDLKSDDLDYARFYSTGKSINAFLSAYCRGLEEAHVKGQVDLVAGHYSNEYRSPARGRWTWSENREDGKSEGKCTA